MRSTTARPGSPGDARFRDSTQKLEHSQPYSFKDTRRRIRFVTTPRKHEGALAIPRECGKAQTNESGFPRRNKGTKPLLRKATDVGPCH